MIIGSHCPFYLGEDAYFPRPEEIGSLSQIHIDMLMLI